jgi:hypothetical protein
MKPKPNNNYNREIEMYKKPNRNVRSQGFTYIKKQPPKAKKSHKKESYFTIIKHHLRHS